MRLSNCGKKASLILAATFLGSHGMANAVTFSDAKKFLKRSNTPQSYYLGLGAQNRHMGFYKNFGNNLFKKDDPELTPFFGVELHKHLAVEFHSAFGKNRTVDRPFFEGDIIMGGEPLDLNTHRIPQYYNIQYKLSGYGIDMIGKTGPLTENIQYFTVMGFNFVRAKLKFYNYQQDKPPIPTDNLPYTVVKHDKALPRFGLGMGTLIANKIGLKGTMVWEKTSQLKKNFQAQTSRVEMDNLRITPKNSLIYDLKIYYQF